MPAILIRPKTIQLQEVLNIDFFFGYKIARPSSTSVQVLLFIVALSARTISDLIICAREGKFVLVCMKELGYHKLN